MENIFGFKISLMKRELLITKLDRGFQNRWMFFLMGVLVGIVILSGFPNEKLAQAYIPKTLTILDRTGDNHGRGLYKFSQKVTLYGSEGHHYSFLETWYVINGERYRLDLEGLGDLVGKVSGSFVYNGDHRVYLDSKGHKKIHKVKENIQAIFLYRRAKEISPLFKREKIIPIPFNPDPKPVQDIEKISNERENFLRLTRSQGVVTYFLGKESTLGSKYSGLWVEQDQFVIRKFRFSSLSEVVARDYKSYPRGFYFPQSVELHWGEFSTSLTTSEVEPLRRESKYLKLVSSTSLNSQRESSQKFKIPEGIPVIKEYFEHFR